MAGPRQALQTGVSLDDAASLARLLPAAVLSRVARLQVGGLDFATSNLRGASFPLYISGARVLYNLSLGPLAGAPFNLTTVSYDGSLDMGLLWSPRRYRIHRLCACASRMRTGKSSPPVPEPPASNSIAPRGGQSPVGDACLSWSTAEDTIWAYIDRI